MEKALTPVPLSFQLDISSSETQVSQRAWRYFVRHYLAMKRKSTRICAAMAMFGKCAFPCFAIVLFKILLRVSMKVHLVGTYRFKMGFRKLGGALLIPLDNYILLYYIYF